MAIKTFTTGEVLTASDTNTYLANAGLVFVKSQTITGTPTSVTVTDAFSATYDNYLVTYTGGKISLDTNLTLVLGSSNTGYYSVLSYGSFSGTTINNSAQNNATFFAFVGGGNSSVANISATITQPYLSVPTEVYAPIRYGSVYGNFIGYHGVLASYTAFTVAVNAGGTFTGGTITVYGYRKA